MLETICPKFLGKIVPKILLDFVFIFLFDLSWSESIRSDFCTCLIQMFHDPAVIEKLSTELPFKVQCMH